MIQWINCSADERPYRYIRQDFFLGRTFRNLDDLNAQFEHWRTQIANPRRHATTNRIVDEAFAKEQSALIDLAVHPYDAVLTVERRVSHEGMVSVGGNLYSVPDTTRKRVLEVQNHPSEIRIFEDGELIARHALLEGRNLRQVDPSHRKAPPIKRKMTSQRQQIGVNVGQRSLAFYDAVARRLAHQEVAR